MGGGSGGGQNTVTNTTTIPPYEQNYSIMLQQNAQNLAAQGYPVYQAPLQANLTPQERVLS